MRNVIPSSCLIPSETLPNHLRSGQPEAVEIAHVFAVVVAERLLIEIPDGVQGRTRFNVLANLRLKRVLLAIRNYYSTDLSATFHDAHDGGLVGSASASYPALALSDVHVSGFAADEGLVRLNVAAGLLDISFMQSHANAVIQEPSGLLSDPKIPSDFARADPVLAVNNQPESRKPLVQTKRRILHDGPSFKRKLRAWMTRVALPKSSIRKIGDFVRSALRAFNLSVRPAEGHEKALAVVKIREVLNSFLKGLWVTFHVSILTTCSGSVK